MLDRDFKSTLGNFLTTVLILDSSDLSDRKDGFDFVSPHAAQKNWILKWNILQKSQMLPFLML